MKMTRKRLYLDVCTLCRPFDDQNMMRVRLETDAFSLILQSVQDGIYEMIASPVHLKEVEAIQDIRERSKLLFLLNKYGTQPSCDLFRVSVRAEQLYASKLGVVDAVHVAFAEGTSDFFISCDDKLLKKCKRIKVQVITMNPIEFCTKEDLK